MPECERCGDDAHPGEDLCLDCIDEAEAEWARERSELAADYRAMVL